MERLLREEEEWKMREGRRGMASGDKVQRGTHTSSSSVWYC